jgi:glutamate synthase (NADPH/NADH) large chain
LAQVSLEPVAAELDLPDQATLRHLGQIDEVLLKSLIEKHAQYTGSRRAQGMLADWANYRGRFVKVMPHEYRRVLTEIAAKQQLEAV